MVKIVCVTTSQYNSNNGNAKFAKLKNSSLHETNKCVWSCVCVDKGEVLFNLCKVCAGAFSLCVGQQGEEQMPDGIKGDNETLSAFRINGVINNFKRAVAEILCVL